MKESVISDLPYLIEPQKLMEISIGLDEVVTEVFRQVRNFRNNIPFQDILICGRMGDGKTHLSLLLEYLINYERELPKINVTTFIQDYAVISDEGDLAHAIAEKSGFLSAKTLSTLKIVLDERGEKALLLLKNPQKIVEKEFNSLLQSARQAGIMSIILSDERLHDSLNGFRRIDLPDYSMEQLLQILVKRNFPTSVQIQVRDLLETLDFIPRTPKIVIMLGILGQLEPHLEGIEIFGKLLQSLDSTFRANLGRMSFQQRKILLALVRSQSLLSPGQIADSTGLQVPIVNAQLKRLRDRGIVREDSLQSTGRAFHYPADRLFRYWLKQVFDRGSSNLLKLRYIRSEFIRLNKPPLSAFTSFSERKHPASPDINDEILFVTDSKYFPVQQFESLAKVAVSYIRGGDLKRTEAVMEIEAERSLNAGQNQRAARAMMFTGIARILLGSMEGAKSALKESISRGERHPLAKVNLAAVYFNEGNPVNARNLFQDAIRAPERMPHSFCGMGAVLRAGGEYKQAEEYYSRALEIDSKFIPAIIGMTLLNYHWGEYESAGRFLDQALTIDPHHLKLRLFASAVAFKLGDFIACYENSNYILELQEEELYEQAYNYYCAANFAESLKNAEKRNFGIARILFEKCLEEWKTIASMTDMLSAYFIVLAGTKQWDFWLELAELWEDKAGDEAVDNLFLYKTAIKDIMDGYIGISVERLFPEDRDIYRQIVEWLD